MDFKEQLAQFHKSYKKKMALGSGIFFVIGVFFSWVLAYDSEVESGSILQYFGYFLVIFFFSAALLGISKALTPFQKSPIYKKFFVDETPLVWFYISVIKNHSTEIAQQFTLTMCFIDGDKEEFMTTEVMAQKLWKSLAKHYPKAKSTYSKELERQFQAAPAALLGASH